MNKNALSTLLTNHRDYFGLTPFDSLIDELVESSFPEVRKSFGISGFGSISYPKVNIEDTPEEYIIVSELAGLEKENVSVDLEEDTLTISGTKQNKVEDKSKKYIVRELKQSSFKRAFVLGDNVDKNAIKADFSNGVLTVKIKKKIVEENVPTKKKIL